jgi:YD repeat-containing protein
MPRCRCAYFPLTATGAKALQLQGINTSLPGGMSRGHSYDYDARGNITAWQQTGGTVQNWTYDYNRSGELTEAIAKGVSAELIQQNSWQYDGAGNRIVENDATQSTVFNHNSTNQLIQVGGSGKTLIEGVVNKPSTVKVNQQSARVTSLPGTTEFLFQQEINVQAGTNTVQIEATNSNNQTETEQYQYTATGLQKTLCAFGSVLNGIKIRPL